MVPRTRDKLHWQTWKWQSLLRRIPLALSTRPYYFFAESGLVSGCAAGFAGPLDDESALPVVLAGVLDVESAVAPAALAGVLDVESALAPAALAGILNRESGRLTSRSTLLIVPWDTDWSLT